MPLLHVTDISKADREGIRLKKEGPHVVTSCTFLWDLHGSRMSFLHKCLLSLHKSGKLNFSLSIRKCRCWQSSLAKCSFGVTACLNKVQMWVQMQRSSFTTWHKIVHKEIQAQLRLKLISEGGWRNTIKFYLPTQRSSLPWFHFWGLSWPMLADLRQQLKGRVYPKITTQVYLILQFTVLCFFTF